MTTSPNNFSREQILGAQISKLMKYELSQLGMAERFVAEQNSDYGYSVRYCNKWAQWLTWTGMRWEIDESSRIKRLGSKSVRHLKNEAKKLYKKVSSIGDEDVREGMKDTLKRIIAHAFSFEQHGQFTGMLNFAQGLEDVPILPAELDLPPMLLNCRNGVVDLTTGNLIQHSNSQGHFLTKMAPIVYDPRAKCPRWQKFLGEVFAGDAEMVSYIQRCIGYGITGHVTGKAMWFLHGGGNNGKTTLLKVIRDMLGDYAGVIDINTLMGKTLDDYALRMIAMLQGKRFITASEPSAGCKLNEALIKHLTGMDDLMGRHIYGKAFQFPALHKLFIDGNHRPTIEGTDDAIWLRVRLVPFEVKFSDKPEELAAGAKPIDRELWAALRQELRGILTWAVHGCLAWQREGLQTPPSITAACAEYRLEQDVIGRFLAERTDRVAGARYYTSDLYSDLCEWLREIGEQNLPRQRWLTDRVKQQHEMGHDNSGNYFVGIRHRPRIVDKWARQARAASAAADPAEVLQ
jgi:putative DNA primase/helicase